MLRSVLGLFFLVGQQHSVPRTGYLGGRGGERERGEAGLGCGSLGGIPRHEESIRGQRQRGFGQGGDRR